MTKEVVYLTLDVKDYESLQQGIKFYFSFMFYINLLILLIALSIAGVFTYYHLDDKYTDDTHLNDIWKLWFGRDGAMKIITTILTALAISIVSNTLNSYLRRNKEKLINQVTQGLSGNAIPQK
jgi:hypothetical protein